MSSKRFLGPVRGALLLAGGGALCWTVYFGATLPEPPPGGDGVPAGFAVILALIVQAAGALAVQVGYALPAGTGQFRFGPLADRSAVHRSAAATVVFVAAALVLRAVGWVLPDSLPQAVSGAYAFSWLSVAVGTVTGVVLTAVLAAATAVVRLLRGEPVFGGD